MIQDSFGVGIDIVELERVRHIRFLSRFAEYFLRPVELRALRLRRDRIAFIASRFAAKEAVIKAFPGFLSPHDFEIVKKGKKPVVRFVALARAERYDVAVSMTHSTEYAAGYAIVRARVDTQT